MIFRFTLIQDGISLLVEEPVGWSDLDLLLKRDPQWHGLYFEYGSKVLTFSGPGADLIRSAYLFDGLSADIKFVVEAFCSPDWVELIEGRLNFGRLRYNCDEGCTVSIPVEQNTCMMKLKARWDTPVDLDSLVAIDGAALTAYSEWRKTISIPPGGVVLANNALVALGGDTYDIAGSPHLGGSFGGAAVLSVRPWYDRVQEQSLLGQLANPAAEWTFGHVDTSPLSPQALIDNETNCFHDPINYRVRMKGSFTIKHISGGGVNRTVSLAIYRTGWETGRVLLDSVVLAAMGPSPIGNETFTFDHTFTGTFLPIPIPLLILPSNPFYAVIEAGVTWSSINMDFAWHFDEETEVDVRAIESCQATDAKVYLIHENLSRVVESATNNCMKVKSDYYGRIDSLPYATTDDGCGSLRALTNGKFLRQDKDATMKITPKQILEGLLFIDNIGMGLETIAGEQVLRVEDFAYFYHEEELMYLDHVAGLVKEVIEEKHYNEIATGYKNWDAGTVSCAHNEYNSERLYSTKFNQTKNRIEVLTELVAAAYAVEQARRSAAVSGTENDSTDWDDKNFIFCIKRGIGFVVEQGNITSTANIAAPTYAINYRITPARNTIRWWRILAAGYRDILTAFLDFIDGKGNTAATALVTDGCIVESGPLSENETIERTDIVEPYITPIWTPEKIIFEYPLSIEQYLKLKNKPNGYIRYQCANGDDEKGWITDLKFNASEGKAQFTLLAKR